MRRLTAIQTLVAVVTCVVLFLQFNEMRTGSKDTHDLAVATKTQSDASKAIAEAAKSQSEATSQIASGTKDEVNDLKASVREEHAATSHADWSLQRSERPWVNAESIEIHGLTFPNDDGPVMNVSTKTVLRNTGRSVATNGWSWLWLAPNTSVQILRENWRKPCKIIEQQKDAEARSNKLGLGANWPLGFVLAPGQATEAFLYFGTSDLTMNNTRNGYWVLGCATYDDQFGNHHHTNFCFQTAGAGETPDSPKFRACNAFQEAN